MTSWADPAPAEVAELADLIAAVAIKCPAVAGMAEAPGGPVATYLPGRTVSGVAVRAGEVEVCVTARYGLALLEVAEQVRKAVAPLAPGREVDVVIGDIAVAQAGAEEPAASMPGQSLQIRRGTRNG